MNKNFNFTLEFGNKCAWVKFNSDPKAKTIRIEQANESCAFGNAIGHILNTFKPYYQVMEIGQILHRPATQTLQSLRDENMGYVLGFRLSQLIANGEVEYNGEVKPGEVYRRRWDGFTMFASHIPYAAYVDGEPRFVTQGRNGSNLVKNITTLLRAQEQGTNLWLGFSEKTEKYLENLKVEWDLHQDGELEELAAFIEERVQNATMRNTLHHMEIVSQKAVEAGNPFVAHVEFVVKDHEGNEIEPESLIGSVIQFVRGNFTMTTLVAVNEENLGSTLAALKKLNAKVYFVDCPANTIEHVEA